MGAVKVQIKNLELSLPGVTLKHIIFNCLLLDLENEYFSQQIVLICCES